MAAEETRFAVDPAKPTVVMTRVFDAPRRLVFEAMTKPKYVARWYGRRGFAVTFCEIDLRPGGAYRIAHRAPDGNEYGFRGVYREVEPPTRLAYTWIFEPIPDKVALVTEIFDEGDGKTTLKSTMLFQTMEDRDGYLQTGANEAAAETMDRLAEVLGSMAVSAGR
jgi:uncharacterized protein YndB with AHSA1/START domain